MPLKKSSSKSAFTGNLRKEIAAGKKPKQAIAISLNVARKAGAKIPRGKARKTEGNGNPKRAGDRG